jgi:hypothetical protein
MAKKLKSYTVIVSFQMFGLDVKAENQEDALNKALWRIQKKMKRPNKQGWPMGPKAIIDRKNTSIIKN